MTEPGPIPARRFIPPTIPSPSVAADVMCTTCGYNLRGLTRDDRCPECGVIVAYSLPRVWKRHADPVWLAGIRRALLVMLASGVLSGAALLCQDFHASGPKSMTSSTSMVCLWIAQLVMACSAVGIAADEPGHLDDLWLRRTLRIVATVAIVLLCLFMILFTLLLFPDPEELAVGVTLLSGALTWLYYERVRQIADRFDWRRLGVLARVAGIGTAVSCLLTLGFVDNALVDHDTVWVVLTLPIAFYLAGMLSVAALVHRLGILLHREDGTAETTSA